MIFWGLAFRRTISQNVELGLSFEYLSTKTTGFDSRSGLPTEDGYRLYPFELTGYFIIPISSQTFKIYIGGGAGMYLGDRIRKIVDVSTESVGRPASFGIHVVSGMDFFLNEEFSIRGEMKFRDPQFDTESKFSNDKIEYDGHTYTVNTQQFKSKINLDGIVFAVEMVWHFAL
jgi:outer membrane protein W